MLVSANFISGPLGVSGADDGGEAQQAPPLSPLALLDGATGTLRRLMQLSSAKLIGGSGRRQRAAESAASGAAAPKERGASQRTRHAAAARAQPDEAAAATTAQAQQQKQQEVAAAAAAAAAAQSWQLECKYTMKEVQLHNSLDDCWMIIFDKVYNISEFVFEHPGGDFILLEYAGRDATHAFLSSRHGSSAYKMLDKYWIGILVDEELYYSNNSSYCSVYSNLSWRSTPPTLTAAAAATATSNSTPTQTETETEPETEPETSSSSGGEEAPC